VSYDFAADPKPPDGEWTKNADGMSCAVVLGMYTVGGHNWLMMTKTGRFRWSELKELR
jgi:hypothetical protein